MLATKFWNLRSEHVNDQGSHPWHIVREVENSLRRLKTERIDLYHVHRPDPDTPVEESLRVMDDLVRAGKVVYAASCRFTGWQLAEQHFWAERMGTVRFEAEQAQLNIIDRRMENEVLPFCRAYGMGATCWGPVAKGRLAGTYTRGGREDSGGDVVCGASAEGFSRAAVADHGGGGPAGGWARVHVGAVFAGVGDAGGGGDQCDHGAADHGAVAGKSDGGGDGAFGGGVEGGG